MMHGEAKKKGIILTEQEKKEKDEKAAKVLEMLDYFFKVRHNKIQTPQDPLELTELMAKLCPEIASIYNYRRELLLNKINKMKDQINETKDVQFYNQLLKIIQTEFMLVTVLLKRHPKSYTLWTHRQWMVLQSQEIDEMMNQFKGQIEYNPINAIAQEMQLCEKMLMADERNFHVWNYRNWLTSISTNKDEDNFTKKKIEQNFSNFSAYHFRSKYFLKTFNTPQSIIERLKQDKSGILPLPMDNLRNELELIQQAIFIQPKEHGIYLYHRWLIGVCQPFGLISILPKDSNSFHLTFNKTIQYHNLRFTCKVNDEVQNYNIIKEQQNLFTLQIEIPNESDITIQFHNMIFEQANEESLIQEDTGSRFCVPAIYKFKKIDNQIKLQSIEQMEFMELIQEISQITDENIEFIKSVLLDEQDNRFPLIQLLYLYQIKLQTSLIHFKRERFDTIQQTCQEAQQYSSQLLSIQNDHQAQYLGNVWNRYMECLERRTEFHQNENWELHFIQQLI